MIRKIVNNVAPRVPIQKLFEHCCDASAVCTYPVVFVEDFCAKPRFAVAAALWQLASGKFLHIHIQRKLIQYGVMDGEKFTIPSYVCCHVMAQCVLVVVVAAATGNDGTGNETLNIHFDLFHTFHV